MNVPSTLPIATRAVQPRKRLLLATVEVAVLLAAPPADLCYRRVMSEQLHGVHGDRLAPIAVIVSTDVPERERRSLFFRMLDQHRRHQAANDSHGAAVVNLASRRPATVRA